MEARTRESTDGARGLSPILPAISPGRLSMKRGARKGWRWRVPEQAANKDLRLLYEPGNWGDILKGLWAVLAARAIIQARGRNELRYFDPFAGSPTYPLVEASRRRLEALPIPWLKD